MGSCPLAQPCSGLYGEPTVSHQTSGCNHCTRDFRHLAKGILLSSNSQQGSPSRLLKQKFQETEPNKCILKEQSNDLPPGLKTSPGTPARTLASNSSFLFRKTKFLEYLFTARCVAKCLKHSRSSVHMAFLCSTIFKESRKDVA